MSFSMILVLAVGLSMDAMAVSAARALTIERVRASHLLRVALIFGGFQALMPALGYWVGARLGPEVEAWDHWIAFGLLAGIGGKMIWDARGAPEEGSPETGDPFGLHLMFLLGIATSIDALAAGISLPLLGAPLLLSLVTIGFTTAILSAVGLYAGRQAGARLGRRLDLLGGLVLIGLGGKILVQHLSL